MLQTLLLAGTLAAETMPVAQQNALIQKHCVVCHTEAARSGGLSLEHFDAATVDPSLAAMLVSKINGGAMGASPVPKPDPPTIAALLSTLTAEAIHAHDWNIAQVPQHLTASIVRELPEARPGKQSALYRPVLNCNLATHQGDIQLTWSPSATTGTLAVSADGNAPRQYKTAGPEDAAAITLAQLPMPSRTLTVSGLFRNETIVFPVSELYSKARETLAACFNQ